MRRQFVYACTVFFLTGVFLGAPGKAEAALITVHFGGTVTKGVTDIGVSALVTGSFQYDIDTAVENSTAGNYTIHDGFFEIAIGGFQWTASPDLNAKVTSASFNLTANTPQSSITTNYTSFATTAMIFALSGTGITDGTALPTSLADLNLANLTSSTGKITLDAKQTYVQFNIDRSSLTFESTQAQVPEQTPSLLLMGSGLTALGAWWWRSFRKPRG